MLEYRPPNDQSPPTQLTPQEVSLYRGADYKLWPPVFVRRASETIFEFNLTCRSGVFYGTAEDLVKWLLENLAIPSPENQRQPAPTTYRPAPTAAEIDAALDDLFGDLGL